MSRQTAPAAARRSQAPFTKGEVNRAGELLLDLRERMRRDGPESAVLASDEHELDQAWEALTWWRSLHAAPLSSVAAGLRYHVEREGGRVRGRIEVAQRLKRQPTMIDKLAREKGRITQMQDVGGVRAVLPSLRALHAVSRRLRKTWTIVRVRDYVAEPKRSGYRALHLIVRRRGFPIEVQLRTVAQDLWANVVENEGRERGLGLKFGEGDAEMRAILVKLAEELAELDLEGASPEEVLSVLETVP